MFELKKCPFCGTPSAWLYETEPIAEGELTEYNVECDNCGASTAYFHTKEEAANAWNMRPNDD